VNARHLHVDVAATVAGDPAGLASRPRMRSAARSATMIVGAFVLPPGMIGMIEASTTRSPSMPCTRSCESTTARSSAPMRHVPTGW